MIQTAGEIIKGIDLTKPDQDFPPEESPDLQWITTQDNCRCCGNVFTFAYEKNYPTLRPHLCSSCGEQEEARREEERKQDQELERKYKWNELCPAIFQDTDPSRLPCPEKLSEVLAWKYGPTGLVGHGDTGKGKSRCFWELAKREFLAGRSVRVFNSMGGIRFTASYSESMGRAQEYADKLIYTDLLFLDDPFKLKLTESVEAMLFAVLNERFEAKRPVIATMNDTPTTLAGRMTEDRGMPLIRRLKEFTKAVKF